MGVLFSCFSDEAVRNQAPSTLPSRRRGNLNPKSSDSNPSLIPVSTTVSKGHRWSRNHQESVLSNEDALVAARLLLQDTVAGRFDRSSSLRITGEGKKKNKKDGLLPRSSSSRPSSLYDPLLNPQQLVNQDTKVDDLETDHFVLVHGGGFGAWCWYKTIALLEEAGFKVDAIDLTGSGVNSSDTNRITSLPEYVKPLLDFMEKIEDEKKVILAGHDFGGACISYTMEFFPNKVAKAIFISAVMLRNEQSIFDIFTQEAGMYDQMRKAQIFKYGNGKDNPPTSIDLEKTMVTDLLFNQSPAKDVALASVSMRSIPFAPVLEKLSLSEDNYGRVRRYYIETTEDHAIPLSMQQSMSNSNPPERVFLLRGSDHAPFFSRPQALHRLLVDISEIPVTKFQQSAQSDLPLQ